MGKLPKFDMDEVLTKAMGQFWRHGYSATSIRDLENATGLFRGSLYHAYGDKREMFFRALHRYDKLYRENPINELEKHPSPREAVLSVFEAAASQVTENGSSDGCLEVNIALELGAHDEDVASFVAGAFAGMAEFLRASIERGQALWRDMPTSCSRPNGEVTACAVSRTQGAVARLSRQELSDIHRRTGGRPLAAAFPRLVGFGRRIQLKNPRLYAPFRDSPEDGLSRKGEVRFVHYPGESRNDGGGKPVGKEGRVHRDW